MKKYVNGKLVDMSADEIKARQEEEKEEQALEPAKKLAMLRLERNFLLGETDWMCFPDSPTMSDEWKKYRQELRDITKTYKTLDGVKWPIKPS